MIPHRVRPEWIGLYGHLPNLRYSGERYPTLCDDGLASCVHGHRRIGCLADVGLGIVAWSNVTAEYRVLVRQYRVSITGVNKRYRWRNAAYLLLDA